MGEEHFCCSSLGAVDYVPLGVAMIHFLMKIEGETRAQTLMALERGLYDDSSVSGESRADNWWHRLDEDMQRRG